MATFEMDFTELDKLINEIEKKASKKEKDKVDKKALTEISKIAQDGLKGNLLRSKDPSKSGRKGSRTGEHSADNVPIKFKTKDGNKMVVIGWEKSDTSPYYYTKFEEWGSVKHKPLFLFRKTYNKQYKQYDEIFKKHYEEFLQELEGI